MSCKITELIKKSRKGIKDNTIRTYTLTLKKLKKELGNKDNECYDFLDEYDKVIKHIENNKITTQKNKLTAIIVLLKSNENPNKKLIEKYSTKLDELNKKYMDFLKTQEKTETQKKNWLEYADLVKLTNKLMLKVKAEGIKNKSELDKKEFDLLKQLVVLKTYMTYPLRNDFADMKIIKKKDLKNEDKNKNYLVLDGNKKEFHINAYKNKDRLGSRIYKVDNKLNRVINLWLKHNKSGYYLPQNDKKTPMNPNNLTKFLNKIFKKEFNKSISTSMIRHITISHLLKDKKTLKEQEKENKEIENKFLHSKGINDLYRKVDE
jgi:hypothetical protein